MKDISINIMGSNWEIIFQTKKENKQFSDLDGYTDYSVHKIYIRLFEKGEYDIEDLSAERRSTLRHEIYHAFMGESGLRFNTNTVKSWATNEEMIDWLAIQYPKIHKVFKQLNIEN